MANEEQTKTTLGDRLSTGAVQAAFWGGSTAAAEAAINGVHKLISKNKSSVKIMSKLNWQIAGITALVAGAFGFFTANKANEKAGEEAIKRALAEAEDPTNNMTQKEREKHVEKTMEAVMDGKVTAESTKHRDQVTAAREAASQQAAR